MIKIFNAFNQKDLIKAAGGRWNAAERFWSLTPEQFATIDRASLDGARIVEPPKPIEIVPFIAGEEFRLVARGDIICAETSRGVIAWVNQTTTQSVRGTSNYYDRHRHAKGDHFDIEQDYSDNGPIAELAKMVEAQLPEPFRAARYSIGSLSMHGGEFDYYALYTFLAGFVGGCAWFGNTDAALIRKIKKILKAGLIFKVDGQK